MKFGRYLIVMVSSWRFAAAVVVGLDLVVDPPNGIWLIPYCHRRLQHV